MEKEKIEDNIETKKVPNQEVIDVFEGAKDFYEAELDTIKKENTNLDKKEARQKTLDDLYNNSVSLVNIYNIKREDFEKYLDGELKLEIDESLEKKSNITYRMRDEDIIDPSVESGSATPEARVDKKGLASYVNDGAEYVSKIDIEAEEKKQKLTPNKLGRDIFEQTNIKQGIIFEQFAKFFNNSKTTKERSSQNGWDSEVVFNLLKEEGFIEDTGRKKDGKEIFIAKSRKKNVRKTEESSGKELNRDEKMKKLLEIYNEMMGKGMSKEDALKKMEDINEFFSREITKEEFLESLKEQIDQRLNTIFYALDKGKNLLIENIEFALEKMRKKEFSDNFYKAQGETDEERKDAIEEIINSLELVIKERKEAIEELKPKEKVSENVKLGLTIFENSDKPLTKGMFAYLYFVEKGGKEQVEKKEGRKIFDDLLNDSLIQLDREDENKEMETFILSSKKKEVEAPSVIESESEDEISFDETSKAYYQSSNDKADETPQETGQGQKSIPEKPIPVPESAKEEKSKRESRSGGTVETTEAPIIEDEKNEIDNGETFEDRLNGDNTVKTPESVIEENNQKIKLENSLRFLANKKILENRKELLIGGAIKTEDQKSVKRLEKNVKYAEVENFEENLQNNISELSRIKKEFQQGDWDKKKKSEFDNIIYQISEETGLEINILENIVNSQDDYLKNIAEQEVNAETGWKTKTAKVGATTAGCLGLGYALSGALSGGTIALGVGAVRIFNATRRGFTYSSKVDNKSEEILKKEGIVDIFKNNITNQIASFAQKKINNFSGIKEDSQEDFETFLRNYHQDGTKDPGFNENIEAMAGLMKYISDIDKSNHEKEQDIEIKNDEGWGKIKNNISKWFKGTRAKEGRWFQRNYDVSKQTSTATIFAGLGYAAREMSVIRNIMMGYAGWKGGEVLENWTSDKQAPITAENFVDNDGKIKDYSAEDLQRAKYQLSSNKFESAKPNEYANLQQTVRKAEEAEFAKITLDSLENFITTQENGMQEEVSKAKNRNLRKIQFKAVGAILGAVAPNAIAFVLGGSDTSVTENQNTSSSNIVDSTNTVKPFDNIISKIEPDLSSVNQDVNTPSLEPRLEPVGQNVEPESIIQTPEPEPEPATPEQTLTDQLQEKIEGLDSDISEKIAVALEKGKIQPEEINNFVEVFKLMESSGHSFGSSEILVKIAENNPSAETVSQLKYILNENITGLGGGDDALRNSILENIKETGDVEKALATVYKGEGVEHVTRRLIEANPQAYGYNGDTDDFKAIHEYSGKEAHRIAIKGGFVETTENGGTKEIRIKEANKYAFTADDDKTVVSEKLDNEYNKILEVDDGKVSYDGNNPIENNLRDELSDQGIGYTKNIEPEKVEIPQEEELESIPLPEEKEPVISLDVNNEKIELEPSDVGLDSLTGVKVEPVTERFLGNEIDSYFENGEQLLRVTDGNGTGETHYALVNIKDGQAESINSQFFTEAETKQFGIEDNLSSATDNENNDIKNRLDEYNNAENQVEAINPAEQASQNTFRVELEEHNIDSSKAEEVQNLADKTGTGIAHVAENFKTIDKGYFDTSMKEALLKIFNGEGAKETLKGIESGFSEIKSVEKIGASDILCKYDDGSSMRIFDNKAILFGNDGSKIGELDGISDRNNTTEMRDILKDPSKLQGEVEAPKVSTAQEIDVEALAKQQVVENKVSSGKPQEFDVEKLAREAGITE